MSSNLFISSSEEAKSHSKTCQNHQTSGRVWDSLEAIVETATMRLCKVGYCSFVSLKSPSKCFAVEQWHGVML